MPSMFSAVRIPPQFKNSIKKKRRIIKKVKKPLEEIAKPKFFSFARHPEYPDVCTISRVSFTFASMQKTMTQRSIWKFKKAYLEKLEEMNPGVKFEFNVGRGMWKVEYAMATIEFCDAEQVEVKLWEPNLANRQQFYYKFQHIIPDPIERQIYFRTHYAQIVKYTPFKLLKVIRDYSLSHEVDPEYFKYLQYRKKQQV